MTTMKREETHDRYSLGQDAEEHAKISAFARQHHPNDPLVTIDKWHPKQQSGSDGIWYELHLRSGRRMDLEGVRVRQAITDERDII